jgi:hypothetical protein
MVAAGDGDDDVAQQRDMAVPGVVAADNHCTRHKSAGVADNCSGGSCSDSHSVVDCIVRVAGVVEAGDLCFPREEVDGQRQSFLLAHHMKSVVVDNAFRDHKVDEDVGSMESRRDGAEECAWGSVGPRRDVGSRVCRMGPGVDERNWESPWDRE